MTGYTRTRAMAQPRAEKGAVAGRPATGAADAGHPTRDLAPRRVS
jgi:hypothetical protein